MNKIKLVTFLAIVFGAIAPAVAQVVDSTIINNFEQQKRLTKKEAEKLVPRISKQPVKSLDANSAFAMDTLDTSNDNVKIILYSDNSWKYWRSPEELLNQEIFTRYWDNESADAYRLPLDSLPEKITIWVVDSLSEYKCPNQKKVYSPFGYRHRRRHQGVDLPLKIGDEVYAAFSGKVRISKYYKGYGNLVVLRHENGLETFYGHLSKINVHVGEWVNAGDVIGLGGSTGRSTGPHLHFETRYNGYAFDPQWLIDFESGILRHRAFVIKKKYLNAGSRYVPESDEEEDEIYAGDTADYAAAEEAARKKAAEEAAKRYYKIRSGDTLSIIAKRNGTTVSKLCQLNGITTKTVLKIGRTIRVK